MFNIARGPFGERLRAGRRLWEPVEEALLRALYPHLATGLVARRIGRSVCSTYQRAQQLGLLKTAAYLASPAACRLRRGDAVGARTRFPNGHVPANKGLRRPGWGPGRMRTTQYKRGQRNGTAAANYMPIGSTRLIEGYIYRKVSDVPNVPYTINWKLEHHRIWTAHHGPIPHGYKLRFCNGDRADLRLDNLELVTPGAMMTRNSVHNLPAPLKQTIQLLGALNRQIRKRDQHASEKQD